MLPEHKHCHATIVHLVTQMATERLMGGQCVQHGRAGQRGASHLWRTEWDGARFNNASRRAHSLKLMNC